MGGSVEGRSSPGSIGGSPSNREGSPTNQRRGSPGRERMIPSMMDDADKDATIRNLREEIERLKGKVNTIVQSAETSLEEAIESQEAMRNELHSKVAREQQKYQHIIAENAALKEVILSLNEELISERQHVEKAVRFMDRIKHNAFIGTADKNKLHSLTGSFSHSQKLHHA
jgi:septal ring factor EnvC (AmiA/AmiB activator)